MSQVGKIIKMIKQLTGKEVINLTKRLQSDIGKPPEHRCVGAYPRKPKPSLSGGTQAVPEAIKQELIEAITRK